MNDDDDDDDDDDDACALYLLLFPSLYQADELNEDAAAIALPHPAPPPMPLMLPPAIDRPPLAQCVPCPALPCPPSLRCREQKQAWAHAHTYSGCGCGCSRGSRKTHRVQLKMPNPSRVCEESQCRPGPGLILQLW